MSTPPGGRRPVSEGPARPRDRHGRGVRGPLAWPRVPAMLSRARRFDELVLDSADRLEPTLRRHRLEVDLAVEEVPPGEPAPWEDAAVPLGRVVPSRGRGPARVVLYRRPIETRARGEQELSSLVHEVVVQQVAAVLGIDPDTLDPGGGSPGDPGGRGPGFRR